MRVSRVAAHALYVSNYKDEKAWRKMDFKQQHYQKGTNLGYTARILAEKSKHHGMIKDRIIYKVGEESDKKHMQQVASRPKQSPNGNTQTQKIVIIAITLFALSGLMMGFAAGAFTRPHKQAATIPTMVPTTIAKKPAPTSAPTPNLNVAAVGISCPIINPSAISQVADGTTEYTLSAEIRDQSISKSPSCGAGKDLHAPDLTCKIWLTHNQDVLRNLSKDQLNPVTNLQNLFPKEEQNAFLFDGNQQQVQPCSQTGTTNWKYKLSPSLKSGTYFLAVVADWKGMIFNWNWKGITIQGQGNND